MFTLAEVALYGKNLRKNDRFPTVLKELTKTDLRPIKIGLLLRVLSASNQRARYILIPRWTTWRLRKMMTVAKSCLRILAFCTVIQERKAR